MKIGIIGGGMIGATLAKLWVEAGHAVCVSSRNPESLRERIEALGELARVGTVEEACASGEVLLLAVPFSALSQVAEQVREHAAPGTLLLDACNPFERRDGESAVEALEMGSGVWTARCFQGFPVVKAFNTVYYKSIQDGGVAVPLAGDDAAALERAAGLVRDAGLAPVVVGGLAETRRFDPGTPVWNAGLDEDGLRAALS